MLRLLALLLCSCAGTLALTPGPECEREYQQCNNACFVEENNRRDSLQCSQSALWQVCPPGTQVIDTVAAGECLKQCDGVAARCW
jgi:hypothetical protein